VVVAYKYRGVHESARAWSYENKPKSEGADLTYKDFVCFSLFKYRSSSVKVKFVGNLKSEMSKYKTNDKLASENWAQSTPPPSLTKNRPPSDVMTEHFFLSDICLKKI